MNNSDAACYCILQQSGWRIIFIFPAVIISSPSPCFSPPSDSIHCGLLLNCKMLTLQTHDGSADKCPRVCVWAYVCVRVCVWGNSLQVWTKPRWGCGNGNDQHLCWEPSLVRVFPVRLGENIWVHTPAGWIAGADNSTTAPFKEGFSTVNKEQRTQNLVLFTGSTTDLWCLLSVFWSVIHTSCPFVLPNNADLICKYSRDLLSSVVQLLSIGRQINQDQMSPSCSCVRELFSKRWTQKFNNMNSIFFSKTTRLII